MQSKILIHLMIYPLQSVIQLHSMDLFFFNSSNQNSKWQIFFLFVSIYRVSVSRRTFGPCNVTVFVWFASTSSLTKCIWSMAISQHQFYIDRHINKVNFFFNVFFPFSKDKIFSFFLFNFFYIVDKISTTCQRWHCTMFEWKSQSSS